MQRPFGAHVSAAGGIENALIAAKILGIDSLQMHPSPPQRWNTAAYKKGFEDKFNALKPESGVRNIFFHAIYLINLATPDDDRFRLARTSLLNYLELLSRIQGQGVIVHVGSMKDQESDEAGYDRAASAIDWIFERSPKDARLILEVAAGSGKIVGSKLEELRTIYDRVKDKERLGFGLDTQHLWASGYDLKNNLDEIIGQVGKTFGFDKTWAIHLNDSMTEMGSRKDRHANIGDGLIGAETIKKVLMHQDLISIPCVLETPALRTPEGASDEVRKLRELLS